MSKYTIKQQLKDKESDFKNLSAIQKVRLDAQSFLCFQNKLYLKLYN